MQTFHTLMKIILTPLLLLTLIAIMTQLLIAERSKLVPNDVIQTEQQRGVGVGTAVPMMLGEWQPYYGGGQGLDSIIALSDSSLRVSTGGDGGWYGARADILGGEIEKSTISLAVYADDWEAVDRVLVMFATNDGFTDYFGLNLNNYFSTLADQEWIEVVIERSEFEAIEGSPVWSEVTDLGIRVIPKPGVSTRVWFDEFMFIAKTAEEPIVSFTFDDGFKSVTEAAVIMDLYGYVGTTYVTPRLLGTEEYMTQDDIDTLHAKGWDIGGHSNLKLTDLIPSDVDTELASVHSYLFDNEYTGRHHFAYPNGAYNTSVQSQVLEYFSSARTIDGFSQPSEYAFRQNINAVTISSTTPITDIIEVVNQARKDNSWLILVWHDFSNDPVEDYEYSMNDFRQLVSYVNSTEVEVQPYSVVYDRLYR